MNYSNHDIPSARIQAGGGRLVPTKPAVEERKPFKQDPRQCRHVYSELGREGGAVVFYCERCLHYEEKQLPASLQPEEKKQMPLGFDPMGDI